MTPSRVVQFQALVPCSRALHSKAPLAPDFHSLQALQEIAQAPCVRSRLQAELNAVLSGHLEMEHKVLVSRLMCSRCQCPEAWPFSWSEVFGRYSPGRQGRWEDVGERGPPMQVPICDAAMPGHSGTGGGPALAARLLEPAQVLCAAPHPRLPQDACSGSGRPSLSLRGLCMGRQVDCAICMQGGQV